jgi:hypothetical protein
VLGQILLLASNLKGRVKSPSDTLLNLVYFCWRYNERWADRQRIADWAQNKAFVQAALLCNQSDIRGGIKGLPGRLVLDQLDAGDQTDAPDFADQRMAGELAKPVLELGGEVAGPLK